MFVTSRGGGLIFGDSFGGEYCGEKTLAAKVAETAEALMGTPSSSGWICEMSMLSGKVSWMVSRSCGGDWRPKSEEVNSLDVTRIALSLGAVMESTRNSDVSDASNVRLGLRGAGA